MGSGTLRLGEGNHLASPWEAAVPAGLEAPVLDLLTRPLGLQDERGRVVGFLTEGRAERPPGGMNSFAGLGEFWFQTAVLLVGTVGCDGLTPWADHFLFGTFS